MSRGSTPPDPGAGRAGAAAAASGTDRPRISVVMPCYNAAGTLQRALDSLAAQTLPPCEVVCVDDASTDSTLQWLRQAATPFPLIIEALPANGGAARARNAGLRHARGDWIAFLDSDDAWHPAKLALQWSLALRSGAQLLGGHSAVADGSGWPDFRELTARPVRLTDAVWRNPYNTSTVLVRAQPGLRFPEDRHAEDFALWLALLRDGCPAVVHEGGLARMYKAVYGAGGLSARLWTMERGELAALADACAGRPWLLLPVCLFSLLKFGGRVARSALR